MSNGSERAVELRGPEGQAFQFVPGAVCLELVVTGGADERAVFERLHDPADLTRWLRSALDVPVADAGADDLMTAKRLREGIWHCAGTAAARRPLPRRWVEVVNACAAAPPPIPRIDRAGALTWRRPVVVAAALSVLARDAVDLLTGPSRARIRRCAAADCTLLFVDTSRPGYRRWCSMQRCGNRAKTRSFRRRAHEEDPR